MQDQALLEMTEQRNALRNRVEQLEMAMKEPKATDTQVGGAHYAAMKFQPIEFITGNGLPFIEGNVIKYVCRHRSKDGAKDIKKAIHYLQLLLDIEYPERETTGS